MRRRLPCFVPPIERFSTISDDPLGITLASVLARDLIRLGQYRGARLSTGPGGGRTSRRGRHRRRGHDRQGPAYGFQGPCGRHGRYTGARQLAEEINRPDLMASATQNLSFEVALDDPRLAVELQREAWSSPGAWSAHARDHDARKRGRGRTAHRRLGLGARTRSTPS